MQSNCVRKGRYLINPRHCVTRWSSWTACPVCPPPPAGSWPTGGSLRLKSTGHIWTVPRAVTTNSCRSKYLRQFRESDYKAIFKSSVDGAILGELVGVLQHLVARGDDPEIVITQVQDRTGLTR